MRALLHTDGGARGNPGTAGIGMVLTGEEGEVLAAVGRGIGITTNNVAEYTALIEGLELALTHGVSDLEVRCDSELVVHQVKGEWKIKEERLRPLAVRARSLMERFDSAEISHVGRAENAAADRLANLGMDEAAADAAGAHPAQDPLFEE